MDIKKCVFLTVNVFRREWFRVFTVVRSWKLGCVGTHTVRALNTTFNELIIAVVLSYLFRGLFLTVLTLLLKTKYSFHIF